MALAPNAHPVLLHDEDYAPIDSVTIAAVVRLAVHAIVGAGGVFDETADDNSVAQGDTLCEILNLPYVNNGTAWIRQQGGTDNASAGTANQGSFVGGIVTSPVDAFSDGDTSLLHFDTSGRLLTSASTSGVTDTDDDSVAAAQVVELIINENYGYDGSVWRRLRAKAASAATSDERLMHLSTMAVLAIIDASAPAGSQEIPVSAARMNAVFSESGYYVPTFSALCGYDSKLAAGSRVTPVAVRDFSLIADIAAAYIGVITNSRGAIYDPVTSDWMWLSGCYKTSVSASEAERQRGTYVYEAAAVEFAASKQGRRFYVTHQTPGTLIVAQLAFLDTTPTFMLRVNSANIRAILNSLDLSIGNTPGGLVYVTLAIDTADRWSAGGTAIAPQNANEESATAAVALAYSNPTATAAGAGTRYLGTWIMPATAGANLSVELDDGVLLGPTAATFLVYVWAAGTAPQVTFALDYAEVG